MIHSLSGSLRLALATLVACCIAYPLFIWGFAQMIVPEYADGHFIRNSAGTVIGSRLIAQNFMEERYFHGRPSAVDCNAAGAGGSNLSPASPQIRKRAEALIAKYGATAKNPIPADLVTASGSGLDPHISLAAVRFQIPRVAKIRNLAPERVGKLVEENVSYPGGFLKSEPVVNVLELNIKLDRLN